MRWRAPAFWWRPSPPAPALALWPLAWAWGVGAGRRISRPARLRPPVAVVCVGNYVVGGAGKTPTVIALAAIAAARGLRPGILARGYGGSVTEPVLVEPAHHRAAEVGDEALLLAAAAPTVVSPDRVAGAQRLLREGVDVILLDDGFQDPALAKDLAIVVVDAEAGVGNGHVLPLGPLRARLAAQVRRTDALLVVGEGTAAEGVVRLAARAGRPVLRASLNPVAAKGWRNSRVVAFAGIGRPQKFLDSLAAAGAEVAEARSFPDHHVFTQSEASELVAAADIASCRLVTTAKDAARLSGEGGALARLRSRAEVFAVTLEFDNPAAVGEMLAAAVRKAHLDRNAPSRG